MLLTLHAFAFSQHGMCPVSLGVLVRERSSICAPGIHRRSPNSLFLCSAAFNEVCFSFGSSCAAVHHPTATDSLWHRVDCGRPPPRSHDTHAEIRRANMEVVNKSFWEMVEEGCSAIESADLESLPEQDNMVSDRRHRCQMRQFVHRAVSAAPTEEEKKLIMVEVELACVCLPRCKKKQKLKRVFGNGKCLKSRSVQNRVRGQVKTASQKIVEMCHSYGNEGAPCDGQASFVICFTCLCSVCCEVPLKPAIF